MENQMVPLSTTVTIKTKDHLARIALNRMLEDKRRVTISELIREAITEKYSYPDTLKTQKQTGAKE